MALWIFLQLFIKSMVGHQLLHKLVLIHMNILYRPISCMRYTYFSYGRGHIRDLPDVNGLICCTGWYHIVSYKVLCISFRHLNQDRMICRKYLSYSLTIFWKQTSDKFIQALAIVGTSTTVCWQLVSTAINTYWQKMHSTHALTGFVIHQCLCGKVSILIIPLVERKTVIIWYMKRYHVNSFSTGMTECLLR